MLPEITGCIVCPAPSVYRISSSSPCLRKMPARAPSDAGEPCQISRWPMATFNASAANASALDSQAANTIAIRAIAWFIRSSRNRSALRLFAPAREFRERFGGGRIDAEDRATLLHLLLHEILEQRLLERLRCDLLGDVLRNDGDAFTVANDDVAGINRHLAAGDRHVEIDRMVLDQVGRRGWRGVIGGKRQPGDIGRVAKAAVGDYSGDAALPQSRHQDAAGRCG